ncbi:MAG: hypothetical protein KAV83_04800 [Desulfobacterales bacterium]|nr:hypothetical protein [Desulfobacterales bacterium]
MVLWVGDSIDGRPYVVTTTRCFKSPMRGFRGGERRKALKLGAVGEIVVSVAMRQRFHLRPFRFGSGRLKNGVTTWERR